MTYRTISATVSTVGKKPFIRKILKSRSQTPRHRMLRRHTST